MTAVATRPKPELVATENGHVSAIVPQSVEQAYRLADIVAKSGLAPRDMQRPEQIMVALLHGMEIGLKPMQAVQSIAVINGRPSIWGDAALALVHGSNQAEYVKEWIEGDGDGMVAHCEAKRRDQDSPTRQSFSVAEAKIAGLWGKQGPWKSYPKRMLQMRARAFALRDAFPDVLKGMAVRDEVQDYQPMRDVTPAADKQTQAESLRARFAEQSAPAVEEAQEPFEHDAPELVPGETDPEEIVDRVLPETGQSMQVKRYAATKELLKWVDGAPREKRRAALKRAVKLNPWIEIEQDYLDAVGECG